MTAPAQQLTESYVVLGDSKDRAAWLMLRALGIGASEAATAMGLNRWKSPFELYAEKVGDLKPADLSDNERVYWGNRLESLLVDAYCERTGRISNPDGRLLRSTAHGWALATLDAWTGEGGAIWPLEIKTTSEYNARDWEHGAPDTYRIQCHQQMLVTGCDRATIACLIGGQRFVWEDIERDERIIDRILLECSAFWSRVERRDPPPVDNSQATTETLARLYACADEDKTVNLGGDELDSVCELARLKSERKVLEANIRYHENLLKAALGDASYGALPDGSGVSWKEQTRGECVMKASTFRVLRTHRAKK